MSRCSLCWLGAVAAIVAFASATSAAEYSTDLKNFVVDSSGEFTAAEFDFEFSFSHIETASLELTAPFSLSGGYGTGSTFYYSSVIIDLFATDATPDFAPGGLSVLVGSESQPDRLRAAFGYLTAGQPAQMQFLPAGLRLDLGAGCGDPGYWQDFLFLGRGDAILQRIDGFHWVLNGSGSGQTLTAPEDLSSVRLIIRGIAVPEPTSRGLITVAIALGGVLFSRSRTESPPSFRRKRTCYSY